MAQNALIKITVDPSRGVATINGVKVALTDLAAAQKQVNTGTEKGTELIEGSVAALKKERAELIAKRDLISTTSETYDNMSQRIKAVNLEIAEIVQNKDREGAAVKGSFQWYEQEIAIRRRLQKTMVDNNGAVQAYEREIIKLRAEQRALTTGTKLTGKGMQSMSSSAGLAGAAATEFGRAVGDAQYGIQGISNNVQQLSALFTDLVQQEGSTRKAFKLFTSTLMGPAGVLVAVSLVTTAIEFFIKRQKEAEKEVERLDLSLFAQGKTFKELKDDLDNLNLSREEELKTLKTLALGNDDLNKILEDENMSIDERIKLGRQLVDANDALQKAEADVQKQIEDSNESYKKLDLTQAGLLKKQKEVTEAERILQNTSREGVGLAATQLADRKAELELIKQGIAARKELTAEGSAFFEAQQAVNAIMEGYKESSKEVEIVVKNSIKDYEKRIEVIQKEMKNVDLNSDAYKKLEKELYNLNLTYQQLLVTQRELDIEMAEAAMEAADTRIEAGMDSIKSEQQNYAKRKELSFREQGRGDEYLSWSIGFYQRLMDDESFSSEERLKFKEAYLNAVDELNKREKKAADDKKKDDEKRLAEELEDFKARMNALKDIASTIGTINDFLDAEAQREIDRETNKTNAINDQLRIRLANEQMSADERDAINQEIARNEAELVEKENAINEQRFKQQKAFNIAMALINTYVAANMALKDETIPNTFARIAAMVAVIATGIANVATISRQQFVAKALPSPRLSSQSGGRGGVTEGPQFNVIGATGQNQLAAAIAAVQKEPVKAYVVSSEVSSAQEMERKAVASASI